jgi:hypothetical protein
MEAKKHFYAPRAIVRILLSNSNTKKHSTYSALRGEQDKTDRNQQRQKGRTDLVVDIPENETDFPIPLIFHSQLGPVSNNFETIYIQARSGQTPAF